jgi:integrase
VSAGTPADQVTPEKIAAYTAELQGRVGSVTVYGSIYKLRRAAELLNPSLDLCWLRELEKDLDFLKQPKSKYPRLVDTTAVVEAGLTLLHEAEIVAEASPYRSVTSRSREARRRARGAADRVALTRAVLARNGLMIALLALCPTRLKNFAALELGTSVAKFGSSWWLVIEPSETKQGRPEERPIPDLLTPHLRRYLAHYRPVLCRGQFPVNSGPFWISAESGEAMPYSGVEVAIRRTTWAALGVAVGPHMFRTSGGTAAAVLAPQYPGLASALLQHVDPRLTEQHYNRATAQSAAQTYAKVLKELE